MIGDFLAQTIEWLDDRYPLGISIDKVRARAVFGQAYALALSEEELPADWGERTLRVGEAKSKTFTPVLGTILLAKATNDQVDSTALAVQSGHKGYSARSLAKEVFVPLCSTCGVDIRTKGAEPFNNQPFLRAMNIDSSLKVKKNAQSDFDYLVECVNQADFLRGDTALRALAAFLRVRVEASEKIVSIKIDGSSNFPDLLERLSKFMRGDSEGGKIGQAVVAAIYGSCYQDARTKKINDPSARWPADVGVFVGDSLVIACEVKQRHFDEAEIRYFAERLAKDGIQRGVIAELCTAGWKFDAGELAAEIYRDFGVDLQFVLDASTLLQGALRFSTNPLNGAVSGFASRLMSRLEELEVSQARREEWAALNTIEHK